MDERYIYLVNETNDGAIRLSAPDGALPGILLLLRNAGYHTTTLGTFNQARRNAEFAELYATLPTEEERGG